MTSTSDSTSQDDSSLEAYFQRLCETSLPVFTASGQVTNEFTEFVSEVGNSEPAVYGFCLRRGASQDATNRSILYVGQSRALANRLRTHRTKLTAAIQDETINERPYGNIREKIDRYVDGDPSAVGLWTTSWDESHSGPFGATVYLEEFEAHLIQAARQLSPRTLVNSEFIPRRFQFRSVDEDPATIRSPQSTLFDRSVGQSSPVEITSDSRSEKYLEWLRHYLVTAIQDSGPTPLFAHDQQGTVAIDGGLLCRSTKFERQLSAAANECAPLGQIDPRYDGILYMMYQIRGDSFESQVHPETVTADQIQPRYIGKAEVYGRENELSENFTELVYPGRESLSRAARWGDGGAYHFGELSNAVFEGATKKAHWATALFEPGTHTLKQPTYIWVHPWMLTNDVGPFSAHAHLVDVEQQLIGLAYERDPECLLNKRGVPDDAPVYARSTKFESSCRSRNATFEYFL